MKHMFKGLLGIALAMSTSAVYTMNNNDRSNNVYGKPFFQGRSQGENLARRLVGNAHELYRCDFDCINGVISIIPEWSQTFNRNDLGSYFSFRLPTTENSNTMSFRGSGVNGATPENTDVRAENFLLASTFDGLVTLKPQKKDFIADINFRINLDEWLCGLYFEIDIPVNWTQWDMNLETPTNDGQRGNIAIDAANLANPFQANAPVETIIGAWQGFPNRTLDFLTTSQVTAGSPNPLNINVEQMNFATIEGSQSKAGIADLNFILGYNFLCNDCYHFGLNIRGTAPTGTRPEGKYVFEPIVGNGHHATLGAGINGHAILWENGCDQSFSLWFDSAVYHMFNSTQARTFDLRGNGIGSRYLLMKRFTPFTLPDETQINQFLNTATGQGTFVPGSNVTTLDAKSKFNVAGEAVIMFNYQRCGFTFDVGYDIWGRSEEKLTIVGQINDNTFGLLGGTPIDNYDAAGMPLDPAQNNPANRTNSTVRINGANASATGDANFPVFVRATNLDVDAAAAPSALSHKVFAHLSYTWEGCDYSPFLGVGGEVEFSGKQNRAFDQWGVWAKGGFAFS